LAVDPIGLGDFGLAGQPLAGGETAIGNAALDSVRDLSPQRDA
jgi:hypothetical protein